jgi:hypothetical protein
VSRFWIVAGVPNFEELECTPARNTIKANVPIETTNLIRSNLRRSRSISRLLAITLLTVDGTLFEAWPVRRASGAKMELVTEAN